MNGTDRSGAVEESTERQVQFECSELAPSSLKGYPELIEQGLEGMNEGCSHEHDPGRQVFQV